MEEPYGGDSLMVLQVVVGFEGNTGFQVVVAFGGNTVQEVGMPLEVDLSVSPWPARTTHQTWPVLPSVPAATSAGALPFSAVGPASL